MAQPIHRRNLLKLGAAFTAGLSISKPGFAFSNPETKAAGPVRLFANENPYGPPESARKAMAAELERGGRYVLPNDFSKLTRLIADREGLAPENVVLGTGSGEVLTMAGAAFGIGGGEIVAAQPTFEMLPRYADRMGGKLIRVPLDANFAHDLDAMKAKCGAATKLVYVCNPNNPTGTVLAADRLAAFCEEVSKTATVFVDEAYLEYADPKTTGSMVGLVKKGKNLIIARTFSKLYGMAGMRIGYGLTTPDIAARLNSYRMTIPNRPGFFGAIAALQDSAFVERSRSLNTEIREKVRAELMKMNISSPVSHGNFIWARVGTEGRGLPAALAAHDVWITGGTDPLRDEFARVTIGTREEMDRFLAAMKTVAKG
jgi:histidinol-phosphate aminotransferase